MGTAILMASLMALVAMPAWLLVFTVLGALGTLLVGIFSRSGDEDDDNPPRLRYSLLASLMVAQLVVVYLGCRGVAPPMARGIAAVAAAIGAGFGARPMLAIAGPGWKLQLVAVPAAAYATLGAVVGMTVGYLAAV
jgi:hypothetical protein